MKRLTSIALPLTLAFIAPALVHAAAPGAGAPPEAKVATELAADTTAVTPGKPFTAAVTLTTSADWHIYWSNAGDGGIATAFKWSLPPAYQVEPRDFPIPATFAQPGGATALGYTGKTTFLFTVTPPKNTAAAAAALAVDVSWLACGKDLCVPGNATVKLSVPIARPNETPQEANGKLFAAARQALPAPVPPGDVLAMAVPFAGGAPEEHPIQIGWAQAPASVEAYPPVIEGLQITLGMGVTVRGQPRQGPLMAVNRMLAASTIINVKSHAIPGKKAATTKIPLLIVYTLPGDPARKAFYLNFDSAEPIVPLSP